VDRLHHRQCVFATRRDEDPMPVSRQQLGGQLEKPRVIVDDEDREGQGAIDSSAGPAAEYVASVPLAQ